MSSFNSSDIIENYTSIGIESFNDWVTFVPTIVIILQTIICVPALILFWRRKHLFPIAGRDGGGYSFNYNPSKGEYGSFWSVSTGIALYWLMTGLVCVFLLWPKTDSVIMRIAVVWSGLLSAVGFVSNRIILLLFNFEIQNQVKTANAERSTTSAALVNNYLSAETHDAAVIAELPQLIETVDGINTPVSNSNHNGFKFDILSVNKSNNIFIRYKNSITNRKLAIFFCLLSLILLCILWIPSFLLQPEYRRLNYGRHNGIDFLGTGFVLIMVGILAIDVGIGLRLTRYWQDAWRIKEEFLHLLLILIIAQTLAQLFFSVFAKDSREYIDFLIVPFVWMAFYVVIIVPLRRSYIFQKRNNSIGRFIVNSSHTGIGNNNNNNREIHPIDIKNFSTLQELLQLEGGFDCFLSFSESEFSSENLLFYRDYQKFTAKYTQFNGESNNNNNTHTLNFRRLIQEIYSIATRYLAPGSPMEINIPSEIREEAVNKLSVLKEKEISVTPENCEAVLGFSLISIYADTYDSVFHLMQNDTFLRFLYSPHCKKFRSNSA